MERFSAGEFKPTVRFLLRFIGFYVVISLLYGFYITYYYPDADPVTTSETFQCAKILGPYTEAHTRPGSAHVTLYRNGEATVSVYEGCNGINVMIVFAAFLVAFGPYTRVMLWFLPLGWLVIYVTNLLRIIFLYHVSLSFPQYLYFTHKYLFTAFIYLIVFLLWVWWVRRAATHDI